MKVVAMLAHRRVTTVVALFAVAFGVVHLPISVARADAAISLNPVQPAAVSYTYDKNSVRQDQKEYNMTPTLSLTMAQGETHYVKSVLTFTNPNSRTDSVNELICTAPDGVTTVQRIVHGGNDAAGATYTVTSRFLVTATTTGTYTCATNAYVQALCNEPGATQGNYCPASGIPPSMAEISGSIQNISTVVGDQAQLQAFNDLYRFGESGTPTRYPTVTVPVTAVVGPTFDVHADVQISDCYPNTTQGCAHTGTSYTTTVNVELIVDQLDSNNSLCSGGHSTVTKQFVINSQRHHDLIYPEIDKISLVTIPNTIPPVVCASTIHAYVLVVWSSGDPFTVDGPGPESDIWLLPTSL